MDSERDQNFRLLANDKSEWVLKIANPAEDPAYLDMQTKALQHIAKVAPTLAIPRVKATSEGTFSFEVAGEDGRRSIVRLLSFLPGQLINDGKVQPALARHMGAMTARLARALRGFFHPAAQQDLLWDLTQAPRLLSHSHHIKEAQRRQQVEKVLDHFDREVLPKLQALRAQIIHNDVSVLNTLVEGDRVTGIIDFGDLIYAPLVCDLAVPISELMATHPYPMETAAEIVAGYHGVTPLEEDELRLIFDLVSTRCAMSVAIANWRVHEHPENRSYIMDGVDEAADLLERMNRWGAEQMFAALRRACSMPISFATANSIGEMPSSNTSHQSLVERRRQVLGPQLELSYDKPLHIVRGEGVWLIDAEGRSYLDAYNNVPAVGHCHPAVVQALAKQAATLNTNTRYLHETIIEYAERLSATLPGDLSICMFVCSGSEANDLAWRLAKAYSGNSGGVVMEDAYHGTTDVVHELSPAEYRAEKRRILAENIVTIPAPDLYRGRLNTDGTLDSGYFTSTVDGAITTLGKRGLKPAAFYVDSVLSSNGIIISPSGYLSTVFDKIRAAGGLCVADEVQSGFGRTGDHFWGFEAHGVIPDIVTLGKPIANGLSMAAVVTTPEIIKPLMEETDFFSTTGGNPVSCAAALAVLNVLEDEDLQTQAAQVGAKLRSDIKNLAEIHTLIGDVRGAGLFLGVELVRDHTTLEPASKEASAVANRMRELGVLVGIDGPHSNVLKIRPPLVFNANHALQLTQTLDQALSDIQSF